MKLDDWLKEKNVHYREKTGVDVLDLLSETFFKKYFGQKFIVDEFVNGKHNFQSVTANPWTAPFPEAALHFTNESFHYSAMGDTVLPGPFITEKTLKCLVGNTGFVPVGQFDTYGTLAKLGFDFSYQFDTTWDADPGNLSRLVKIVELINTLTNYNATEIFEMTRESSNFNYEHVWSGNFNTTCQEKNNTTIDTILKKFG
jgi:hypothetical protein